VPSFVGSSFAFISPVIVATGYGGTGANPNVAEALGGIIACGVVYALIALAVMASGTRWIERLMPPVVTGSVVAVIGLNLASIPVKAMAPTQFDAWMEAVTFVLIGLVAVFTRGMVRRLLIVVGLVAATVIYAILANGLGLGKPVDGTALANAAWLGIPHFTAPIFDGRAIVLIAPVALILVAENLGHLKAVSATTGRDMDPYIGRAFLGDAVATVVSGSVGGTGTTTYAENIGVMAATRIYSTALFVVAGLFAVLLGLSPKFGALIHTIPDGSHGRRQHRRLRPDLGGRAPASGSTTRSTSPIAATCWSRPSPWCWAPAISPSSSASSRWAASAPRPSARSS
jgi:uracil-xanthine permease